MDIFIQEFGRSNITDNYQKPGKIKKSIYKELYTPKFNPKEWEIIDDPILTPREKEKSREREKIQYEDHVKSLQSKYINKDIDQASNEKLQKHRMKYLTELQAEREKKEIKVRAKSKKKNKDKEQRSQLTFR